MKNILRVLIFVLAFQMEVRVRASAGNLLEQPQACLKSKEVCAIQALAPGFHLENENLKIHATTGSTLLRFAADSWRLVQGTVWLEDASGVRVETLYGTAQAKFGQYWLVEKDDKIWVRNVNADLIVTLKDGKELTVPEGFEFWMSGVGLDGKTSFGMLQPISVKDHLALWNSLYRGDKESFLKEARKVRENWGDLAEKSSQIYRGVVDRQIAAEKAAQARVEHRQAREAQRLEEMRKLYRAKVFER